MRAMAAQAYPRLIEDTMFGIGGEVIRSSDHTQDYGDAVWASIDTAPQNTFILVWDSIAGLRMAMWRDGYEWCEEDGRNPLGTLTHWMPFPEPPK